MTSEQGAKQGTANAQGALKLGLIADSPVFPGAWSAIVAALRQADELGYDSVWLGEAWGYELFTSLADLARETQRIKLGAGVANVFSRSPALIASTAATLDERSNGRMLLGLGTSGPQVVEHWHGISYHKPLRRLKEYTEIINAIVAREPLRYAGEVFTLQRGFTIRFKPPRTHIPIYIASLTPRSIIQTGAIADGVLPTYWPAHAYPEMRRMLDEGSVSAGRPAGSVKLASYIMCEVLLDEGERAAARMRARGPIAFYIGRMGTFYADMLASNGFADDVAAVKNAWETGHQAGVAAVSDALLDATAVIGTPDEVCARLREWVALGLEEPLLSIPQGEPEDIAMRLKALAIAAKLPGA
jgi:alkanesulfonate monooxygenase SsuD/methylene tetrahydromethanopterin reductase-like flavin-dependent oxidoreductase (luciferase family)